MTQRGVAHCRTMNPVTESEHYFSARPSSAATDRVVEFTAGGVDLRLDASAGVFSSSRLDPGTAVLLRKAPLPSGDGEYLDLGCGYGPIAVTLARVSTGRVTAVDVNDRALELVRRNADSNDVGDRVTAVLPDEAPKDRVYDEIWSNPPIRIGKDALHVLLLEWLPRLAHGGVAWLVVARHKGADSLASWLGTHGFTAVKHASQKGYRVLRVTRAADRASEDPHS